MGHYTAPKLQGVYHITIARIVAAYAALQLIPEDERVVLRQELENQLKTLNPFGPYPVSGRAWHSAKRGTAFPASIRAKRKKRDVSTVNLALRPQDGGLKGASMQLHLTVEGVELLKRLADDKNRFSCHAMTYFAQLSAQPSLQGELDIGRELVGKGLTRNLQLGFDELEDLVDLLTWRKNLLTKEISEMAENTARSVLEQQLSILTHLLERVTEACEMID